MHLNGKKLLKCHLKGKANRKLANGQNIDYSEKRKWASSAPVLGLNTIIFKHVYWYSSRSQVSVYRTIGPLVNFCSWFFYGYQNKRNQHSNLFDNGHFCDFLVSVLFVVYFQN